MADSSRLPTYKMYTIGWIAALDKELTAALAMLDETHEPPEDFEQNDKDSNIYSWGQIGDHNIVIASLGGGNYGLVSAATTAMCMANSLPHLRFGLMVGIGAGVPNLEEDDVRLGDVVVSLPTNGHPGVIQYDLGKIRDNDRFQRVGALAPPPTILLKALDRLKAAQRLKGSRMPQILSETIQSYPMLANPKGKDPAFVYQGAENDRLFEPGSVHISVGNLTEATKYHKLSHIQSCFHCDAEREIKREERPTNDPEIHYGTIASGNLVIKDGVFREQVLERLRTKVLCYEMEAAGLMNNFPCLVIRGICDYADTHKNDRWQNYAAIVAAAYGKELLSIIEARSVKRAEKMEESMEKVSQSVSRIESTTNDTHNAVRGMAQKQLLGEIVTWLAAPDPSGDQNAAFQQHHTGTGQWFLQDKAYQQCHTGPASCLWLHGMLGCGKTILSSAIINDLEDRETDTHHLLFFYFTFADDRKRSLDGLIRSLINQLSSKSETARKRLTAIFNSKYRGFGNSKQASSKSLREIFETLITISGRVWIVLDALDECHLGNTFANEGLLMWLKCLLGQKHYNLRIIVTSRRDRKIELVLDGLIPACHQISLQSEKVNDDIRTFIHTTIRTWTSLTDWHGHEEVQKEIADYLIMNAHGMFRWVSCQLYALEAVAGCRDYEALKDALHSLPKTLDGTYARVLDNIPDVLQERAQRILQFLVYSTVPLLVEEAAEIAQIFPQAPRFKRRLNTSIHPDINAISVFCPSLVEVVTQSHSGTIIELKVLRLSHFSVKEYLMSRRSETQTSWGFEDTLAQASMAEACLAYLLEIEHDQPLDVIIASYPLAHHAARHWIGYACRAGNNMRLDLVREFIDGKDIYKTYQALLNYPSKLDPPNMGWSSNRSNRRFPSGPVSYLEKHGYLLHHFSYHGLLCAVKETLRMNVDAVNFQYGEIGSCLQAAISGGHFRVVEELLKQGADVNAQSGKLGTALQAAAAEGHCEVVRDLLNRGADVDARGSEFGNALQASIVQGCFDIMEELLNQGADVNAQGGKFGTALQAAAIGGYHEVVEDLLNRGADINARGGRLCSALQAAAAGGYPDKLEFFPRQARSGSYRKIVRDLLSRGADVNAQGGLFGNPLQAAAAGGYHGIVKDLLSRGADVNAQGGKFGTALQAAAATRGCHNILRDLLSHGAEISVDGGLSNNALTAPVTRRDAKVVRLLLGENVNFIVDQDIICLAMSRWHKGIVTMLLDRSSTVSKRTFAHACQYGSVALMNQLLKTIPSTDIVAYCSSALPSACRGGRYDIVQGLIKRNAEIGTEDDDGHTALYYSALREDVKIMELLTQHGAKLSQEEENVDIHLIPKMAVDGGFHLAPVKGSTHLQPVYGSIHLARLLLMSHNNVQLFDEMLRFASTHGTLEAVTLALERFDAGHQTEAKRLSLTRALAVAIRASNGAWDSVVKLLLDNGADANGDVYIDYHNAPQESMLCYLLKTSANLKDREKLRAVVELFLEHGADPNTGCGPHGSAVDAAIWAEWMDMADLLVERGAEKTPNYEMVKGENPGKIPLQDELLQDWAFLWETRNLYLG